MGINICLYDNFMDKLALIILIKRFILYVKYTFECKKILFFMDKENENIKAVVNAFNMEYLLEVKIKKLEKERELYRYKIV